MNNCCFTGYLVDNPVTELVNNVLVANLTIVVYNYRKQKAQCEKSRTPTYIKCQAWHTGAELLERFATKGTKITFNASVKNVSKDNDSIIFRINEFDLCHQEFWRTR